MRRLALLTVAALLLCGRAWAQQNPLFVFDPTGATKWTAPATPFVFRAPVSFSDTVTMTGPLVLPSGYPLQSGEMLRRPVFSMDWCGSNPCNEFVGAAVSSGTSSVTGFAGEANHPGVMLLSSAAGADSGYNWFLHLAPFLLAGGELYEAVFQVSALTNLTARFGFGDATSVTAPVDGVFLTVASTGDATGYAVSNSTPTATATTYTVSAGTWYRVTVDVKSATLATFTLYSETGTVLWSDSVKTNIPTGAGRNTGAQAICTRSDGGTAALIALDYQAVSFGRALVR